MSKDPKDFEVVVAPGAFDNFEGTQEELDNLLEEIQRMVKDGTFFEESEPLDLDQLAEEDPELYESLMRQMEDDEQTQASNTRH